MSKSNTTLDAGVTSPVSDNKPSETKKEEYEEIFVPKNSKGDDSLFIAVNGQRILVKKGMPVKVPKAHAEVWYNSLKQKEKNEEFIAENAKD